MRIRVFGIAVGIAAVWWRSDDANAAARCSYIARYPSAIGRNTFMLAMATPGKVSATIDTVGVFGPRAVPAQIMRIDDVAGLQAGVIREGLRASGGTAVFVRYWYGPNCGPVAEADGAFDGAGVRGLYVGRPRSREAWIDGRPTFDIFLAKFFPLPQAFIGPSARVGMTARDTTPTMTAEELFEMYQTLWAESVSVDDPSVEQRIKRWLAINPRAARKEPAQEVAGRMVSAVTDAKIAVNSIPFGGTYAISVVVPGIDSIFMYGRTSYRTRPWLGDVSRDSSTGLPLTVHPRSFAIDLTTANTLTAFGGTDAPINNCSPIPIIVDQLPIGAAADSTWNGEMWPSGFFACAAPGSILHGLSLPGVKKSPALLGSTPVRFRRRTDGRITFEARTIQDGRTAILVRGERVSADSYGRPFN